VPGYQELPVPRHTDTTKAAIKNAVDIVALVGEYLQVRRAGSKFKALCPFHDDHNPSLELNPERQSFKCWSCGAGGDVFDFVKSYEHVDFPEALRMLADRAGIVLESPSSISAIVPQGPTKSELLAVHAWAEEEFTKALSRSETARAYIENRGIAAESAERFRLGYAPEERGWLLTRGRLQGYSAALLEQAGLLSRPEDPSGPVRERFWGRLIFPIHDERGRPIGFGGRILPEVERNLVSAGKNVAKYLNSPETALFQKRKVLYAADLARAACREAGWVAVVEGYTDVIAAHQVGLKNIVGTLGTALGPDHVQGLRRLADRVVLVFDGDAAGQSAADRALELFLGHELDVRVLSLPANLDPCDFLLKEGAEAFRRLVAGSADPLNFILERAATRFDFNSIEGARRAADWVLGILSNIRPGRGDGVNDIKLDKAVDSISLRLRLPVLDLRDRLRKLLGKSARRPGPATSTSPSASALALPVHRLPQSPGQEARPNQSGVGILVSAPIRFGDLDMTDRELVRVALDEADAVPILVSRVTPSSLRDEPLRAILQACYEAHAEGRVPHTQEVMLRLVDPQLRAQALELLMPVDPEPMPEHVRLEPWQDRLRKALVAFSERERKNRLRDIGLALAETDEAANPDAYRALQLEYRRLMNQRPDTKKDAS